MAALKEITEGMTGREAAKTIFDNDSALNRDVTELNKYSNKGYSFAGTAVPTTDPIVTDRNIFYIASTMGVYTNFGGITVGEMEVAALKKAPNGWEKQVLFKDTDVLSESGAVPVDYKVEDELFVAVSPASVMLDQKQHSTEKVKVFTNAAYWEIK